MAVHIFIVAINCFPVQSYVFLSIARMLVAGGNIELTVAYSNLHLGERYTGQVVLLFVIVA